MIVGAVFAFLLIAASVFVPKLKPSPVFSPQDSVSGVTNQNASNGDASIDANIDTTNWKTYKDPVYHFTLKYPEGWENPKTKKISDPDFDYEYQVSFGTKDTLAGDNFEGFNLYVFQTGKCGASAGQANGSAIPNCSTNKSSISVGTSGSENILEFSSMVYSYTLVPYIAPENADPNIVKKINLEFEEAGKTFQYDSSLSISVPKKPLPPKAATPVGRRGKLTGAVASGGKLICPHPNRKPMKSPNQGKHVDEDCCPDPDEYPNIACAYKPSDYKIMLKP